MIVQYLEKQKKIVVGSLATLAFVSFAFVGAPLFSIQYSTEADVAKSDRPAAGSEAQNEHALAAVPEPKFIVTHLPTPEPLKALYMTSWVAGTRDLRNKLIDIADETEINALVIDIKDYSGVISFEVSNPSLKDAQEVRIPNIKELIGLLHEKGIYVIGRITVFQDPLYAKSHPHEAVQKESDKSIWKDYKGLSFVDASSKDFWKYIVALAEESYEAGFDELNFDYIRFPSDGNMKDIYFPLSEKRINEDTAYGKASILKDFFAYLHSELSPRGIVLSADLFGMTATNHDDLNIGQILEYAEPYFDFLAPMVYPSHYPKGFNGYSNVNEHPYDIVNFSLAEAAARMSAASSSPSKIRPWLQDFDYPVSYTPEMVTAQIQATYDVGLTSWMLWDPSNTYTRSVLQAE